jgi:hypothetical protein
VKKGFLVLLAIMAISCVVLIYGVSLAVERGNSNPILEECRAIPKFEYLFAGEVPEWVLVRNRKCILLEKGIKDKLEAVKSAIANKK